MTKTVTKEKSTKPAEDAVEAEPRYCLSGSGKVVKSKKALFAMGGDAILKSRILRGDIDGSASGMEPLSKEAIKYAKDAWPHLFDDKGRPVTKKPVAPKAKPEKAKVKPVKETDEEDEDDGD